MPYNLQPVAWTPYPGISLMQRDAMKQSSDANLSGFVWRLIMLRLRLVTWSWTEWAALVCVSCDSKVRFASSVCVCVRHRLCTWPVDGLSIQLICLLVWDRSSPAKAVSHKNQPLSQHITARGISNGSAGPGSHGRCFIRTPLWLFLPCCFTPATMSLSTHTQTMSPAINLPLTSLPPSPSPSLLYFSWITDTYSPSLPFSCTFFPGVHSLAGSISVFCSLSS